MPDASYQEAPGGGIFALPNRYGIEPVRNEAKRVAQQDQYIDEQRPVPDTGPLMFLSLFLLLLAFFILLTAISTLEETKSRRVLSSVAATFKTQIIPDNTAQILISTIGPVPEPEEVIDDVERLWVTAIPIARVESLSRGRTLQLTIPATEIFVGGEATLRADRKDLLRATGYALAARLEGYSAQLRFTIPVDELAEVTPSTAADVSRLEQEKIGAVILNPDDTSEPTAEPASDTTSPDRNMLPFARATAFARALVDAGAPPDGVAVGVAERRSTRIRLRFDIIENGRANISFAGDGTTAEPATRLTPPPGTELIDPIEPATPAQNDSAEVPAAENLGSDDPSTEATLRNALEGTPVLVEGTSQ
ncbi:hypothetical protein [Hwanghaeella sp.]|uniref:hypothetical protein n=1 Tax=Hwanghaeella sp. TaxID=2605943 RepID=UPI003CCC2C99